MMTFILMFCNEGGEEQLNESDKSAAAYICFDSDAADFLASTVGVIILFASYKSTGPKVYMTNELIIHGLSALCYVMAIIYLIVISMSSSSFDGLGTWLLVDFAGLAVCLAGITVTVVCSIKRNRRV